MVYESEIPNRLKCASSKRKSFVIVSAHDVPADPRVPPSRTRARRTHAPAAPAPAASSPHSHPSLHLRFAQSRDYVPFDDYII